MVEMTFEILEGETDKPSFSNTCWHVRRQQFFLCFLDAETIIYSKTN